MIKLTTDWHCGVKRSGGTTPQTQVELQGYVLESLREALDPQHDHLIAGDLLDQFTIDTASLMSVYGVLSEFLTTGRHLAVVRGNHDFSVRGNQASSFDLLMHILEAQFPGSITVAREVTEWRQFVLVPHLPNNELLKLEVARLNGVTGRVIVFHANYDNFHAADTQHSLNLTQEMVEPLLANGNQIVLGHEHDHRSLYAGRLLILGNGVPSSVADCLSSQHKFAAMFNGLDYALEPMVNIPEVFAKVDWRDLPDAPDVRFIRVTGEAPADQASQVVDTVAKFRQTSQAYVVSNAVRVDGVAGFDALAETSFEEITSFSVLDALLEELTEEEGKIVKELLEC